MTVSYSLLYVSIWAEGTNYKVEIIATYPLDKDTGHTEIRKKYVVHVL